MGEIKYKQDIEALFKKSPVVNYSSIFRIINQKKKVKSYTKRIINYMLKKSQIKSITKGYYTIYDNISLTVLCFQPAYLGLQDAMSFHNIWEQETIPIIITSRKIRSGMRKIMGKNILIRRIKKKYIFGLEYDQQNNAAIPYSDIEKTFIDIIYFKEKLAQDALNNFKKKINKEKLSRYLKSYPKKFREKVLKNLT